MREIIADKELSGAQPVQDDGADNEFIEAANDNEHLETKTRPSYKKGATLRLDGPVVGLVSLEKGAAYLGVTKSALRAAIQRGQMPGHKTRSNPEDEKSDGTWWFNAKAWDELADELLECEPPEWHNWKSYWTYDRKKRKFSPANKEDCQTVKGKQVYSPRVSKLEQLKNNQPG
ncbi:transcriptional regulator [Escherichia coli]|nr:transcriptional regulator [Escherichia coli]